MQRFVPAAMFALALLSLPSIGVADEWPQWRGPRRDGVVSAPFPTGELPDRLVRQWEREIGGGYSGPVVAGDRVWAHSRQEGREVVRSLRLGDGEVLWNRTYEAPFRQDEAALQHGLGPYATPSLADGRLFMSVNPTLVEDREARVGPARPEILQFRAADLLKICL